MYEAATMLIERLMDAEPNTKEIVCLDLLAYLVEEYEEHTYE